MLPLIVEARLTWAGSVLAVRHHSPRGPLRVGDLGLPLAARAELVVATSSGRQPMLVLPSGEVVPAGCKMVLRLGRTMLHLSLVPAAAPTPRATSDGRVVKGVLLGAVIHGAVLAIAILGRAPTGDQEAGSREALNGYLAAIDARSARDEREALAASETEMSVAHGTDGAPSSAAKKHEEGAAGNPSRVAEGALTRKARGADRAAPSVGEDRSETFGMIALLAGDSTGAHPGSSAFSDFEGPSAMGNIFGTTIDDAPGFGGLGLTGMGRGGGGQGAGVPLETIGPGGSGTCGAGCTGTLGRGVSMRGLSWSGTHVVRSPFMRCGSPEGPAAQAAQGEGGCATQVNGRLPPEVVQRVVRQSFGRLRACYEAGLLRNPSLEGRISVKFVIDREGAVTMVSAADATFPDSQVTACVARAYGAMTFPKPVGGIVTVVYPVVFGT